MTSNLQKNDHAQAAIERLLLSMPCHNAGPLNLNDLTKRDSAGSPRTRADCLVASRALVQLLSQLGLVECVTPDLVRARSDDACAFLHSLGECLKAGLPLLGDWTARGEVPSVRQRRALVGLLEDYRTETQGKGAPASRRVTAVAALVKGRLGGEEVYLVQYNPLWRMPWWIGGIIEPEDPNPEAALRREIKEELGVCADGIDHIKPLGETSYRRRSERTRALTDYHTHFFTVALRQQDLPEDLFLSKNETEARDNFGRRQVRSNFWLSWEQLRKSANFDDLAGDVADWLERRGAEELSAPHSILPAHKMVNPGPLTEYWDTNWPTASQIWLATRVQEFLPIVQEICRDAQQDLKTLTDDKSFDAYLTGRRRQVHSQVHAIYAALRRREFPYRLEPWDSHSGHQRVRLPLEVLKAGGDGGCCIELACVMASCLLSQQLHPLLVVLDGHALLGYWLDETLGGNSPVMDWNTVKPYLKAISFVETTCLTIPGKYPFPKAQKVGHRNVRKAQGRFLVDVWACRQARIWGVGSRPPPW